MRLLIFPLVIISIVLILQVTGVGSAVAPQSFNNEVNGDFVAPSDGVYDVSGHQVMTWMGGRVGEAGHEWIDGGQVYWLNATNAYDRDAGMFQNINPNVRDKSFPIYYLKEDEHLSQSVSSPNLNVAFSFSTLGVIALVSAIIIIAGVAGLHVFGSGITDSSVKTITIGTGLLTLWGMLSLGAYSTIVAVPFFGYMFYFFLTLMYALGVFQQVS